LGERRQAGAVPYFLLLLKGNVAAFDLRWVLPGDRMTATKVTSTGHALADASWLDHHFQSARPEYEQSLRHVGIKSGWTVLDAGCGGGNFLSLMGGLVGPQGSVIGLDLAPENIAHIEALVGNGAISQNVRTRVGSILSLPFENATFDCVWSANVMQYLTQTEFERAIAEFKRVLKPGGTIAIKEHDTTILQFPPMDPFVLARFTAARRAKPATISVLGGWSGTSMSSRFRGAGLAIVTRKGWLVERWAPVQLHTRASVQNLLVHYAKLAEQLDIPAADLKVWREAAANPESLLDDPDFCAREFFVLTVGRLAN
jgi:SAM-dependent methyltransferase